ncbi:MAG: hypothetical protein ACXV3D_02805 [Halobacteriota archaeon]
MAYDIVKKRVDSIATYAKKTRGLINTALLLLLVFSGVHLFSTLIFIENRYGFVTLSINAMGLIIVAFYFWYLAHKPQFLILSINEAQQADHPADWLHRAETTKYTVYGLFVLGGMFVTFLAVFFGLELLVKGSSLIMPEVLRGTAIMGFFFVALIVSFLLGYQASINITPIYAAVQDPLLHRFITSGRGVLPNRVALGSSHNIILQFVFSNACSSPQDAGSNRASDEYVEAELQAAAVKVDGEKRLRLCDTSPLPVSTWSCHFTESGRQTLNLIISEIDATTKTQNVVFTFEHKVDIKGALITSVQPVIAIMISTLTLWASLSSTASSILQVITST